MSRIAVIGSLNMDLVIPVENMPKLGQTVQGSTISYLAGGKGANQAVAASRLGNVVSMIGCIGSDSFGEKLLDNMKSENIDVSGIEINENVPTGLATIIKTSEDNSIVVVPGANKFCSKELVETSEDIIKSADVLIIQLEIPMETVQFALEMAKKYEVKTILNPAPAKNISKEVMKNVDFLTPNETEFEFMSKKELLTTDQLESAMLEWQMESEARLIVTRGKSGASYVKDNKVVTIGALPVKVIDTTGAGDTFNGALAHAVLHGFDLEKAVRFSVNAASLSTRALGAQAGMPSYDEVYNYI